MKRLVSLFLALTLCVGMLPAPVWAEEEPTEPTQAVEELDPTEPSEEPDPTTEPTEEETTEPAEAPSEEPTEEPPEPTQEETGPAEPQILEEPVGEVAAFGADGTEDVVMLEAGGKTTYYASVKEAIDAATKAGTGTVTLLTDAVLENSSEYDYFDHTNQRTDLTIVLDGHTLTGELHDSSHYSRLTIDGTKPGSTFSGYLMFNGKENVLTINGGTYRNETGGDALYFGGTDMQLNITGGDFQNRFTYHCDLEQNVTGGTFHGITCDYGPTLTRCRKAPYCFVENGQKVKLSDLELTTDKTLTVEKCTDHTYDENQLDCIYCGQRNPAQAPAGTVATVDGQFYSDLLKAIQAADASGKPVVMFADCLLPDGFGLQLEGYTVAIDLNGKTLSVQPGSPIQMRSGNVTLTNAQTTGGIAVGSGNNGSAIVVQGGSLTVESGVRLEGKSYDGRIYPAVVVNDGTVILRQGATLVNGIRAPEGHTIAEYLAEGSAYAVNGQVTNGYVRENTGTLTVVEHGSHVFSGSGSCDCGLTCTHESVDMETGKCAACAKQIYQAKIGEQGYATLSGSLDTAAKSNDGSTVTMLCDAGELLLLPGGKYVLDLNGQTTCGFRGTNKDADVTIKSSKPDVEIAPAYTNTFVSGTYTIEGGNWKQGIDVGSATLNVHDGEFANIRYSAGSNIAISGGSLGAIFSTSAFKAVYNFLAPGYAFYDSASKKVADGSRDYLENVYVAPHTHDFEGKTQCACGVRAAASVTADGKVTYYQNISDAIAAASSPDTTVTLLNDINGVIDNGGTDFTLDLNGKTLAKLSLSGDSFTLLDSQQTGTISELQSEGMICAYLKEGWCLVRGAACLEPTAAGKAAGPLQVESSGAKDISWPKKASVSYGLQRFPCGLGFALEDPAEVVSAQLEWTFADEPRDPIGPTEEMTRWSEGDYSSTSSWNLTTNLLDFDRLIPGNTYGILATVTLTRQDGSIRKFAVPTELGVDKIRLGRAEIRLMNGSQFPFRPEGQTSGGQEQTVEVGVFVDGKAVNGTEYEVTGNTGTNAGTYTLTVKAKEDSAYYTGDQFVSWEILPLNVFVEDTSLPAKTYDGTAAAQVPALTVTGGIVFHENTDYILKKAEFVGSSNVGTQSICFQIELTGDAAKNYRLVQNEFQIMSGITPATPPAPTPGTLTVTNGSVTACTLEKLENLLAPLTAPCTYGTITYGTPTVRTQDEAYAMTAEIENGGLKLNVTGTGNTDGQVAVVTIPVTTQNYGYIELTINVSARNKIVPAVSSVEVSGIVYGQKLEESTVTSYRFYEPGGKTSIPGSFRWEEPEAVLEAGIHSRKLIFVPDDIGKYAEAEITAYVTVSPRPITLSGVTAWDRAYDGTVNAEILEKGTFTNVVPGDTVTYTVTGTFADKKVAWNEKNEVISKPVALKVTLTGDSAKNYTLSENSQTETAAVIGCRSIRVTGGISAQDRDYEPDRSDVRIIKGTVTFSGKIDGDELDVIAGTGSVFPADAGENKHVGYGLTLTGADVGNYALLGVPSITVTIRPIPQTLSFAETSVTKTYGDAPFVNALTHAAGDGRITYTSSDPAVATVDADGTVTICGAGTAKIMATAGKTQNYVETAASFDLTVAKAQGTVRNKNYSLGYLYGDDIPTPERKYFEASSTGEFRYSWSPAAPKNAGNYQLTVTVDADGNYTSATLVLDVLVEKDMWAMPTLVKAENETVDGKKDGKVTYTDTPALEYRPKRTREWIPVAVSAGEESVTVEGLAPGTYEFRRPGDENHFASSPETITIAAGPKLTVTLPSPQIGYSLTADKAELSWHDSLNLTLTVTEPYYKTASFAVKAGNRVLTEENGTFALTNVEEDVVITLEGVEKDEIAPSLSLRSWTFARGVFQGLITCKEWTNLSASTDPYYIFTAISNAFTVEASDGQTGLAGACYLLSRTALTREALEKVAWEPVPEESLNQGKDLVREQMMHLDPGEWYFYVKAVDKAGNVSYVGSDRLIREENAPTFSGVTEGAIYYTTQKVTITDDYALSRYLAPGSENWEDISGTSYEVTLEGNREAVYTMKAEDACQNTSTLTVYMKPISALTEEIKDLTDDNIQMADDAKLTRAENALKGLDTAWATDGEKKEIADALGKITALKAVLEEVDRVEGLIAALPDSVEPWNAGVEKNVKAARTAYDGLTEHQRSMVDDGKLTKLEAQLVDYRFTAGETQSWALGSGKDLLFSVNGQLIKVKEVRLNGQAVDADGTAQAKGTDFVLKAAYLQTLKPGSYALQVIFADGHTPETSVTVTVSPNYLDLSAYPEFDADETVTVNGRTCPIGTVGGRYVNLPETGDILQRFTYLDGSYSAAHENYPVGMTVYRIHRQEGGATLEPIDALDDLLIYAGCSIRISGKQGIRMITGIGEANKKALTGKNGLSGYTLEEYGTLICWNTDVSSGDDFSLDMACARSNYAYKKGKADPVFARQDGRALYTNVLVGFSLEDCAKDLVLRPYIKLKDTATGETVILYGGSVCRSIGYIAGQNADTYKPGSSGYQYVHNILKAIGQEP